MEGLWELLIRFDPLTNMAIIGNSCFLLVDFCNSFSSEATRRRFLEIDQLETRIACGSHIC
jgi:hypothetical protein